MGVTGERHFHATSMNSRVAGWRLEDIDDNLAADFDGSLSGLGVDLSVASYNMRSVFKVNHFFFFFFLSFPLYTHTPLIHYELHWLVSSFVEREARRELIVRADNSSLDKGPLALSRKWSHHFFLYFQKSNCLICTYVVDLNTSHGNKIRSIKCHWIPQFFFFFNGGMARFSLFLGRYVWLMNAIITTHLAFERNRNMLWFDTAIFVDKTGWGRKLALCFTRKNE